GNLLVEAILHERHIRVPLILDALQQLLDSFRGRLDCTRDGYRREMNVMRRLCLIPPLQFRIERGKEAREMVWQNVENAWAMDDVEVVVEDELVPTRKHRVEPRLRMQIRECGMVGIEHESRATDIMVELAQREDDG